MRGQKTNFAGRKALRSTILKKLSMRRNRARS